MELKSYQARTINELKEYISIVNQSNNLDEAYTNYWNSKGISPDKDSNIKPYQDTVKGTPHVCLKVPTAGGKTFIGCNSIKAIFDGLGNIQKKAVVWLVPSDAILEQTVVALKDAEHPYRQKINVDFANRVEVYEKSELLQGRGFSSTTVKEQLSIFILSFDSLRVNDSKKYGRKVYQDNSSLLSFADDIGVDINSDEDISLMKVISSFHPVVIVDESHNATSSLSVQMLQELQPSFILDLTATPRDSSNIISFVTAQELKAENMVKLPVIIQNNSSIEGVIGNALHLRQILEIKAKSCQKNYGTPYIRPIVLFQAQPKSGEEATTFDKLKQLLIKAGCKEEEIAIKTSEKNELKNIKLTSERCKIRYIITVNALKEGWDCPFAYVLASVANRTSDVDVTQILGRILRLPYVQHYPDENLNSSYVLTNSSDFFKTVDRIAYTLNQNHFTGEDIRAYEEKEDDRDENNQTPVTIQPSLGIENPQPNPPDNSNTEGSDDINNVDISLIDFTPMDDSELENIDTEGVSSNSPVENEVPQSTQNILDMANQAQQEAQKNIETNKDKPVVPPELQPQLKSNEYAMKAEYKEEALKLDIPQFSIPLKDIPAHFDFDGFDEPKFTKFYKNKLLHGFELSKEDTKINFKAEVEMFEIDASASKIQQMTFKKISGTELDELQKILCGQTQKKAAKIEMAKSKVMEIMDSKYPIDDKELASYVERILEGFTEAEFEKFASNILLYTKCISEKIDELSDAYSEPKFYNDIEADKIQLEFMYKLPETQNVLKTCSAAIPKSLYEKEGDMNDFEKEVIFEVANMENIEWWHRNIEKKGFEINGVINHYPDFIVKTKSGKIIMIETKGDHLIATKKIKLGNKWAELAGKNYKYFLVYDKLQVEGSKTKDDFYKLIKEL